MRAFLLGMILILSFVYASAAEIPDRPSNRNKTENDLMWVNYHLTIMTELTGGEGSYPDVFVFRRRQLLDAYTQRLNRDRSQSVKDQIKALRSEVEAEYLARVAEIKSNRAILLEQQSRFRAAIAEEELSTQQSEERIGAHEKDLKREQHLATSAEVDAYKREQDAATQAYDAEIDSIYAQIKEIDDSGMRNPKKRKELLDKARMVTLAFTQTTKELLAKHQDARIQAVVHTEQYNDLRRDQIDEESIVEDNAQELESLRARLSEVESELSDLNQLWEIIPSKDRK